MLGKTNIGVGGAALNYSVVGGTTQPTGKENLIWVNTDQTITGHVFSADTPASPSEGLVWFRTGTSSVVAFSATRRNPVMVYPMACQQYVSGAWVFKTAKTYQGSTWVDWSVILYSPGDVHETVTGGYEGKAIRYETTIDGYSIGGKAPTVSLGDESMVATLTANSDVDHFSGSVLTKNKIDLTTMNTVRFKATIRGTTRFYVSESNSTNTTYRAEVVSQKGTSAQEQTVELDVSELSGEFYIGFNMYVGGAGSDPVTSRVTVTSIVAEQ